MPCRIFSYFWQAIKNYIYRSIIVNYENKKGKFPLLACEHIAEGRICNTM